MENVQINGKTVWFRLRGGDGSTVSSRQKIETGDLTQLPHEISDLPMHKNRIELINKSLLENAEFLSNYKDFSLARVDIDINNTYWLTYSLNGNSVSIRCIASQKSRIHKIGNTVDFHYLLSE